MNVEIIDIEKHEKFEYLDKCAIQAMNSLIANQKDRIYKDMEEAEFAATVIARIAYKQAKEMLKVRSKIRVQ